MNLVKRVNSVIAVTRMVVGSTLISWPRVTQHYGCNMGQKFSITATNRFLRQNRGNPVVVLRPTFLQVADHQVIIGKQLCTAFDTTIEHLLEQVS